MVIYLKHPLHGGKVACAEWEAELDESNGWVRYNPDTPDTPVAPVNGLTTRPRGRPRKTDKE